MKKTAALLLSMVLMLSLIGCSMEEEKNIVFPFAVGDVENVEMFRSAVPVAAEKKVVTESADIESLYNLFERVTYTTQEVEEYAGATVYSFRFNLSDGTNYVLIYASNGVKNGVLSSPTAGFRYFTSADLGGPWSNLNEDYETISIEESELPGNTNVAETPNALVPSIMYNGEIYRTTGKQIPAEVEESAYAGKITSIVPLSERPREEGQANFGEVGAPFAVTSEGFVVLMNNEWTVFEVME